ncbi:MAG: pyridoxamine 5'-phosphate oxidase family protein [Chthoniobacteraceae bacterium]
MIACAHFATAQNAEARIVKEVGLPKSRAKISPPVPSITPLYRELMGMNENPSPAAQREQFHELLKQFSTAMLITNAGEDRLRARPMAVARVEDDDRVWFITGAETAKVHEIENDTRVHLVAQNDRSAYLSLSGHADLVRDRSKVAELWQEPFRVWFPEGKDDPNIELILVHPDEGEFWDNEGVNKVRYIFQAAKAYVTGTTPAVAEGEQHGRVRL